MPEKPKAPKLRLIDEILFNRIDLERFSVYEQRKLTEILNLSLARTVGQMASQDITQWNRERLSAYVRDVNASYDAAIDKIKDEVVRDTIELGQMLMEHVSGMLNGALGGVEVFHSIVFTEEKVRAILNSGLENRRMTNLFGKLKENTRNRFEKFITATWDKSMSMEAQGFSLDQMVRGLKDLSGPFEMTKREVDIIHHSYIMNTGNETYQAIYEANADVIKSMVVCVKLDDGRACEVCIPLAGREYNLDGSPQGDSPPLPNGIGPQFHFRCRCCMVPETLSYDELAGKAGPLTKRARGQLAGLSPEEQAAWKEDAPVPEDQADYIEWLNQLDDATQLEVLGAPRYRLFKKGKLKARSDLTHQQRRGLSLDDLKKKWSKK